MRFLLDRLIVLAGVLCMTGCVLTEFPAPYKGVQTVEAPAQGGALSVQTDNGSVDVEATPTSAVTVVGTVRARTQQRLDATRVVAERDANGTLNVYVRWPDGQRLSNEGCSFDIRLPSADGVGIRTSNGSIRIKGLAGPAGLETTNGSVHVAGHAGPVHAGSTNGSIEVDSPGGIVELSTTNGSVSVKDAPASVELETSNGGVRVALTADNAGPVNIETSNAPVTLTAGPGLTGRLEAHTSNATIRVPEDARVLSKGRRETTILLGGDAARDSSAGTIRTSNGEVTIRAGR